MNLKGDSMVRKRVSSRKQKNYILKWKQSGICKTEFCRQHGLSTSTFNGWFRKLYPLDENKTVNSKPSEEAFLPLQTEAPLKTQHYITIKTSSGAVVRIPL